MKRTITVSRLANHRLHITVGIAMLASCAFACAQSPAQPAQPSVQTQLDALSSQLASAEQRLQQSQQEIDRLQQQLAALRSQVAAAPVPEAVPPSPSPTLAERVDVLEAEVKQHDQSKVESASKYHIHFTGLILFNSFLNSGQVDNFDFPAIAQTPTAGTSNLGFGGSMRQTTLGILATGPRLLSAQTSAKVNFDFNGGIPYENFGTAAGIVRLRTAAVRLDWTNDSIEAGLVEPLISPLSPTSYATIAEPALAWAGNLWTWAPQLSYQHRFALTSDSRLSWQFGLWDPPSPGYNTGALFRTPSAGERTAQPALESRIAFARNSDDSPTHMQLGLSGYYSRQSYTGRDGDSWAVTTDWMLPVSRFFSLSGEAYRGRALGGLGGGAYKDIVTGTSPLTGAPTFNLLNDAGGWAQAKFRFAPTLEANAAFGEDNAFARDFHSLVLAPAAGNTALRARNQMFVANLIFSPRTYLILSPEFRRIRTSPITGSAATANIFTTSFGLRF